MQRPEIDQILATSRDLAHKAAVEGTPAFIINGTMYNEALDEDTINEAVKKS
jgi:protein-disulfide isomerase